MRWHGMRWDGMAWMAGHGIWDMGYGMGEKSREWNLTIRDPRSAIRTIRSNLLRTYHSSCLFR